MILLVLVHIAPESLTRDHLQIVRRPHGIGQIEVPITNNTQVCFEFFFTQMLEAARRRRG